MTRVEVSAQTRRGVPGISANVLTQRLRRLEGLRRQRIMKGMTHAARQKLAYHLWWHPHNFGRDIDENLATLRVLLEHYRRLGMQFGMVSRTMQEQADANARPMVAASSAVTTSVAHA